MRVFTIWLARWFDQIRAAAVVAGLLRWRHVAETHRGDTQPRCLVNRLISMLKGFLCAGLAGMVAGSVSAENNTSWSICCGAFTNVTGPVTIGNTGSFNELSIRSGGSLSGMAGTIGLGTGARSNRVILRDDGSSWSNDGDLTVGWSGSDNLLRTQGGATLSNTGDAWIGRLSSARGNQVVVKDANTSWSAGKTVVVGGDGDENRLTISLGAYATCKSVVIGNGAGQDNGVMVLGIGSVWDVAEDIVFGASSRSCDLQVLEGGRLTNRNCLVAGNGQRLLAFNAGSVWEQTGDFTLGLDGANNQLSILSGAVIRHRQAVIGFGAMASGNDVLVSSGEATWECDAGLIVGTDGSRKNSLRVSSGGVVQSAFGAVGDVGSHENSVTVSGVGARWVMDDELYVGRWGSDNRLTVSSGAMLATGDAWIGRGDGSYDGGHSNRVLVTGRSSLWKATGTVTVGENVSYNRLSVVANAVVDAAGMVIGSASGTLSNRVELTRATVVVTNDYGSAVLEIRQGHLENESGTVVADVLVATNLVAGAVSFPAGAMSLLSADVATGEPLTIGDETRQAILELPLGPYAFADGLRVSSNSVLHVRGIIRGDVRVDGRCDIGFPIGDVFVMGGFELGPKAMLDFGIAGYPPATHADRLVANGPVALAGQLAVTVEPSFRPVITNGASFTLVTGAPVGGGFSNVENFKRLTTTDSAGSFRVNILPDRLVLSEFFRGPVVRPSAPVNVSASVEGDVVTLRWSDTSECEDGVKVYRSAAREGPWQRIATVGPNVNQYVDASAGMCTKVFYRLRSFNTEGQSPRTTPLRVYTGGCPPVPAPPVSLTAQTLSASKIRVCWAPSQDQAEGVILRRALSPEGPWKRVATLPISQTCYTERDLTAGTRYYYSVKSFNVLGMSDTFTLTDAWTQAAGTPDAPAGLTVTPVSFTRADLRWVDRSGNETGFVILRRPSGATTWLALANVGANVTTYSDTTALPALTYDYAVRARNSAGQSAESNIVTVTMP